MPLSPGTRLGPYEILAPLGAGGMGEVYRAADTRLGRTVAIKLLNAEHSDRFEREARAIAALNHPHICALYDIGPDYLVMEYVEGSPLRGPLPPEETVRLAWQIADALEAAHQKGIIHRDLKPGNILLTASGIKLLDFGLAKLQETTQPIESTVTQTQAGTILGTAAYMSPEQADGRPVDPRSDIFCFGSVLYEMLSGRRAFGGASSVSTMVAILHQEPEPLRGPPEIESIIRRCLRKNPADRYQTAAELKAALQTAKCSRTEKTPSIAVLPFANMSGDKEQEYFSDGMAEEIINALAQVSGLKVTARTSAFAFKGKDVKVAQIATELGVEHILEGSIRKAGSRVRVSAQLINATDGFHLWSERWDRELNDIFAVQDKISAAIASALRSKLVAGGESRRHYAPNVAAYEAYLKARYYTWKFTPGSFLKGREFYEQAIALDPQFALPYAGLAEYYHIAGSGLMDPEEAIVLGREAALKGLGLDPGLPEANVWLGIFAVVRDFDWKEAARRFRLALVQEPVQPVVRHLYGYFYLRLAGRAAEAVEEHRRALEADPLNLIIRVGLAVSLRAAGKAQEASEEARRILELDPNFAATYTLQALDVTRETLPEALAYAEKGVSLAPWNLPNVGLLAGLLARNGDRARAQDVLRSLGDGEAYGAPCGFAIFHFLRSEIEQAAEWTEKAIEQKYQLVAMLLLSPPYLPMLRSSSRWPALAKKTNLPEAV